MLVSGWVNTEVGEVVEVSLLGGVDIYLPSWMLKFFSFQLFDAVHKVLILRAQAKDLCGCDFLFKE